VIKVYETEFEFTSKKSPAGTAEIISDMFRLYQTVSNPYSSKEEALAPLDKFSSLNLRKKAFYLVKKPLSTWQVLRPF